MKAGVAFLAGLLTGGAVMTLTGGRLMPQRPTAVRPEATLVPGPPADTAPPESPTVAPAPKATLAGPNAFAPPADDEAPLGARVSPVPGDSSDGMLTAPRLLPPADVPALNLPTVTDLDRLRDRSLLMPVAGFDVHRLRDNFAEARGSRVHEAIDIPAPRGTPVLAVDEGTIVKLFTSQAGGFTVYQFDPTQTYAYYYAHLDRYADGLAE